jgi:catechol 2,3-dioxygenase-like lactoylglutathione lyase family enzyme
MAEQNLPKCRPILLLTLWIREDAMEPKLRLPCVLVLLTCFLLYSASAFAQLAEPPNDLGVRLGHIHLMVKDVEAQTRFWTEMMGGTVVKNGPLTLIQFPGVYIMLRQGDPTAAPAGSIVDHFGFVLKNITAARAKWKAAGVNYTIGATNPNQGYVEAPDGVRVEVFGDPSLPGPVGMDHIHMLLPAKDIPAIQAWYNNNLGGLIGKRKTVARSGVTDCVYFHRFNVSFSPNDMKPEPTKGRSLDHIGFEVKNLDEFVKRLEAAGNKMDGPPRLVPNSNVKIAFFTDPWGTYIELTENLAPVN